VKRTALLATLALVAVTPAIASAAPAKPTSRTITSDYTIAPGISAADGAGAALGCTGPITGCWDFTTVKGEKTVTITADDETGTPVGLQVFTDDDYAGNVQFFCGTATITVSPKAGTQVGVRVAQDPSCSAVATTGTLKAVITNR
jgi:hypothetical protein